MTGSPTRTPFDDELLREAVAGAGPTWSEVHLVAETQSTNADAAAAARDGAPEGWVTLAEHQTGGRGRLARPWVTPPHAALLLSVVWRPADVPAPRWTWLPLVAGLAVDAAVRGVGVRCGLKWPNDVLVDERKLCGILLERVDSEHGPAAILGIGLNVDLQPHEAPVDTATSLAMEGARIVDRTEIAGRLLGELDTRYRAWRDSQGDPSSVRAAYRTRCVTIGARVRVHLPDGSTVRGTAEDVDDHGRLIVDGTPYGAGDVVHVRAEGRDSVVDH